MEIEDDNIELTENCSLCRKSFKEGEGRFRKSDWVCCLECYKGRNSTGSGEGAESLESPDS